MRSRKVKENWRVSELTGIQNRGLERTRGDEGNAKLRSRAVSKAHSIGDEKTAK
jgi:hypothetical protein